MLFRSVLCIFVLLGLPHFALADHGPKKMWKRQIQPYFTAHRQGKWGLFQFMCTAMARKKPSLCQSAKTQLLTRFLKTGSIWPRSWETKVLSLTPGSIKNGVLMQTPFFMGCRCQKQLWRRLLAAWTAVARLNPCVILWTLIPQSWPARLMRMCR